MYRIGEVANMLNIDKTVIFEKMINNSKELSSYVVKKNSITFITQKGIEVLDALIHNRKIFLEEDSPSYDEIYVEEENSDDDLISEEDLEAIKTEKNKIKEEILQMRNKIFSFDTEIKRLDEAILNYENVIKDDLEWIRVNEGKVKYRINYLTEFYSEQVNR